MDDWRKYCPWTKALPPRQTAGLATLWALGKLKAPGTWGSVAGALFAGIFFYGMNPVSYIVMCAVLIYIAVGVCDVAEAYFGEKDPGKINFDEFAAMPLCYFGVFSYGCARPILWLLVGFALFRVFDILKPFGIKKIQNLSGGLGCVMDDVAAAAAACLILNIIKIFV
ncbi:MAG: phosphatidylglycerophosphatase A [Opitutales bacterium]|nr:phosphatidylglycerophosphatase A [Opitutales bacterium]